MSTDEHVSNQSGSTSGSEMQSHDRATLLSMTDEGKALKQTNQQGEPTTETEPAAEGASR